MSFQITVTISGPPGSGTSTVMREIELALSKAGVGTVMDCISPQPYSYYDDMLQGRRLDILAKRVRDNELEIELKERKLQPAIVDDLPF